ncbi:hypothetical protein H4V97_001777 [Flavobacterium sp. CG_23.5]|uniref:hypothetical protein n=1 Tax=Flavobacterium sp. CG_23.5 TaxID=2760708 RepID=UPI001AE66A47|nr:hypothetical protein [Flavobacterium sp. CG_23.5]MBP2283459.1 hypothetical protein [Flavobacterium sp. CG_23.5]
MKKKQGIINLTLVVAVLFSMLFQSVHSYTHLVKQFSEKRCHHTYNVTNSEITHQHHNFDNCSICQFTFGSYISPNEFSYQLNSSYKEIPYFFTAKTAFVSFSGSLYSLRGPPVNSLS